MSHIMMKMKERSTKNMKMMVEGILFLLIFVLIENLDDFIVDDDNRPIPKPSHRRYQNTP